LVVPLGTENLLAKHFGLTTNLDDILQVVRFGRSIRIDAGEVNGRLFLVMFSCGFDAAVVSRMHNERKGHISRWSWAKPIWQTIQSYRYPWVRLLSQNWRGLPTPSKRQVDGIINELQHGIPALAEPVDFEAKWVFVFNVPRYAAGLPIAEDAVHDDGLLDVCSFRGGSLWLGLMYLWAVFTRSHKRRSDCRIGKCEALRLESRQEVPYQIDGDYGGVLPVDIRVIPDRVTLWIGSPK
jgi:diacylglycerol kinase family enzyme